MKPSLTHLSLFSGNGDIIRIYESMGDAAADVGGYKTNISRACANPNAKYKGVFWKRMEVV